MRVATRLLVVLATLATALVTATAGTAGASAAPPPPTRGTPCAVTAKACMDLSSRQAWLTDGAGHVVAGPVAARGGTPGYPTPVGTFRVQKKVVDYVSQAFDAPMPYSVFFSPGIAFHAGKPSVASHGCIHLPRAAARQFFDALQPGDRVQVVP